MGKTKVFGFRHLTNPKSSLKNTLLILELDSRKFIMLEVQLKYYKIIQWISRLTVVILSSFVIYIRTMAMSLKQLKFNYGYVCSKNQFKNNMAARTATGSP